MKAVKASLAAFLALSAASSVLTLQCCEASAVDGRASSLIKPMTVHQLHNKSPKERISIRSLLEVDGDEEDGDLDTTDTEEDVSAVEIISMFRRSPKKKSAIHALLEVDEDQDDVEEDSKHVFAVETTPMLKRRGGAAVASGSSSAFLTDLCHRMKIGFYFALWYALNVVYNSKLNC